MIADITALLATYNRESMIKEVLNSVLKHRFRDYKVLIVNGGSERPVLQYLRDFARKYKDSSIPIKQKNIKDRLCLDLLVSKKPQQSLFIFWIQMIFFAKMLYPMWLLEGNKNQKIYSRDFSGFQD